MPIQRILKYPKDDNGLRRKSFFGGKVDKRIRALVRDLRDSLHDADGAGLAAPQIARYERVCLVCFGQDKGEKEEPTVLINPIITAAGEMTTGFDGCLSIPDIITWKTLRPRWLRFSALNEAGKEFEMEVAGIDARLVHHEIDHLDGVLFLDRVRRTSDLYRVVETEDGEELVPFDVIESIFLAKDRLVTEAKRSMKW